MTTDTRDEAAREPGPGRSAAAGVEEVSTILGGLWLTHDRGRFRVAVVDASGDTFLSLGPYGEDEIVAVWRSLARASGLPLVAPGPDGGLRNIYPQLGRLVLGRRSDPRRLAVLSGRRPRFLTRRKAGKLPGRPVIYREPELAGGLRP